MVAGNKIALSCHRGFSPVSFRGVLQVPVSGQLFQRRRTVQIFQTGGKLRILTLSVLLLAVMAMGPGSPFPGQPGADPWNTRPDDPEYADTWQYFSHIPYDQIGWVPDNEAKLGSGMHVDRAWQLFTGDPTTKIAVLDSGIIWNAPDLRDRFALNTGELPIPNGADGFDANGDGRVTASDWLADPQLAEAAQKGYLLPQDLLAAFSDGIDSDGNGYVDDIAGWDFLEADNDPEDRTEFGHGTMEGNMSAGAVNNGVESAGPCGDCSVGFLRVNDSFMVDGDTFAAAVRYAVDNGYSVIQAALGAFNSTPALKEAIDYAWRRNVIVVSTAADENSFHNNQPAQLDQVLYVNALRYNDRDPKAATSYLAFNNCSNFGARIDLSASGKACSSEATARTAGIVALGMSYARHLRKPLSAGELIATLRHASDDINLGFVDADARRMPTMAGWDSTTGHGRANAYNLLVAIRDGGVFPAGRILSPRWFDFVVDRGLVGSGIPVDIDVPVPSSGFMKLRLLLQKGVEQDGAERVIVSESPILTKGFSGKFAEVDLSFFDRIISSPHENPRYRDSWTLVLEIDDLQGHTSSVRRTFQRPVSVPDLIVRTAHEQFATIESTPLFIDLNSDGADEVVYADAAGFVHVIEAQLTSQGQRVFPQNMERPGFPVQIPVSLSEDNSNGLRHAPVFAPLAAGELRPGTNYIVAVSIAGDIVAVDGNGKIADGFPVRLPIPVFGSVSPESSPSKGVLSSPVLVDLDLDGFLEIVVTSLDGNVHVFRHDGTIHPGFPVPVYFEGRLAKIVSSPAVEDVNGDGIPDLVFGTSHYRESSGLLFALSGRGMRDSNPVIPGFPARIPLLKNSILPLIGTGIAMAPAIGDIDGDGQSEIITHGFAGKAYVVGFDGRLQKSMSMVPSAASTVVAEDEMAVAFGQTSLFDLDGDGALEIIAPGVGRRILVSLILGGIRVPYRYLLGVWHGRDGTMVPSFPKVLTDTPMMGAPIIADVSGDGVPEIVVGDAGGELHAFNTGAAGGSEVSGFPKRTGGWMLASPVAGDFDGDGRVDIAGVTREGFLFVWRTPGRVVEEHRSGYGYKGGNARLGTWVGSGKSQQKVKAVANARK